VAEGLVLLEAPPVSELRCHLFEARRLLLVEHRREWDPWLTAHGGFRVPGAAAPRILQHEHDWFVGSIDQLEWFLRIVEEDQHGGNRQALGQYWRLLLEALDRHITDEQRYLLAGILGSAEAGGPPHSPEGG
jgi:hypothetical protein